MRKQLPWFKAYPEDWLANGMTLFLSPAQRGVAISLWSLSHVSPTPGVIQAAPGKPMKTETICLRCRCKPALLNSTLELLKEEGKITISEEGIFFPHWQEDQEGTQLGMDGQEHPARQAKKRRQPSEDPNKYIKGKYGHMVQR